MNLSREKTTGAALENLPPRRRLFVREYVKDFNGGRAAARAGYTEKAADQVASRLLRNVKVRAAVSELSNDILAGERSRIKVQVIDFLGRTITDNSVSTRDRLRAAELLGKFAGLWTDNITVQNDIVINFEKSEGNQNNTEGF